MTSLFVAVVNLNTSVPVLIRERAVFARESFCKMYSPTVHALSYALVELPWLAFQGAHGSGPLAACRLRTPSTTACLRRSVSRLITEPASPPRAPLRPRPAAAVLLIVPQLYFMVGLNPDPEQFFFYLLVIFVLCYLFISIGHFAAAYFSAASVVHAFTAVLLPIFFVFGGLFLPYPDIPIYWRARTPACTRYPPTAGCMLACCDYTRRLACGARLTSCEPPAPNLRSIIPQEVAQQGGPAVPHAHRAHPGAVPRQGLRDAPPEGRGREPERHGLLPDDQRARRCAPPQQ